MVRRLRGLMPICTMICIICTLIPAASDEAAAAIKMSRLSVTLYLNEDNLTKTGDNGDLSIRNKPTNFNNYTFNHMVLEE